MESHEEKLSGSLSESAAQRLSGSLSDSAAQRLSGSLSDAATRRLSQSLSDSASPLPQSAMRRLSGSLSDSAMRRLSGSLSDSAAQRLSGSLSNSASRRLSQLLDDELNASDAHRLLATMADNAALCASWRRYHGIRQSLRGEPLAMANSDFAVQVGRLLASEPTFLHSNPSRRAWLKPLTGLALAASISALAVLGMQESGVGLLPSHITDDQLASGVSETISIQRAGNDLLSQESILKYLEMHNEGVYLAGADGMVPQARVVSIVNP